LGLSRPITLGSLKDSNQNTLTLKNHEVSYQW